jgi:hypothetical protein
MTGNKVFLGYSSKSRGAGDMRSAFADVFKKFGPAVSGVRVNVASDRQARHSDGALLLVDLCMWTRAERSKCMHAEPLAYFICLDAKYGQGQPPPSLVWKHDTAQVSTVLLPTKLGDLSDWKSYERCLRSDADDRVALRFLFQAKSTLAANHAAQTLCSQLARDDVATGRPDQAAERILLWLMYAPDGAVRRDLRLRDLEMLDGWCDFEVQPPDLYDAGAPFEIGKTGARLKSDGRTEELRTAFVEVLRKTASRELGATRVRPEVNDEASELTADYVSAAQVVALYYGKKRSAEKD